MKELSIEQLTNLVDQVSQQYFFKPFIDQARYNHRLQTTGGRYIPSERCIEVNPKYVCEMSYNEVIGIIKHELCHYHLHIEGKPFGHGDQTFKQLMKETNSPRFCKPLPSNISKQKIHVYQCTICKTVYHRKRRVNIQRVRCGKCKGQIEYETCIKNERKR